MQAIDELQSPQPLEDPLTRDARDFSEMARDVTDEATNLALSDNDRRILAQVDHALARMEAGSYGFSEVSGKPIPLERLDALPWATTNVDDAPDQRPDRGEGAGFAY